MLHGWAKGSKDDDIKGQENGNPCYIVAECLATLSSAIPGKADHILIKFLFHKKDWKTEYFQKKILHEELWLEMLVQKLLRNQVKKYLVSS